MVGGNIYTGEAGMVHHTFVSLKQVYGDVKSPNKVHELRLPTNKVCWNVTDDILINCLCTLDIFYLMYECCINIKYNHIDRREGW